MQHHIGIDVSKDYLDIHSYPDGQNWRVRNQRQAIGKLADRLRGAASVVMEATSGYERLLLTQLREANLPVAIVNGRRIRHFARSTGRMAKTDRLDASVIAQYAATVGVCVRDISPDYVLKDWVVRRRQLVDMLVQEKNRREKAEESVMRKQVLEHIAFLNRQLRSVDEEIAAYIKAREDQRERFAILTSVPGVGEGTAAVLLADMPELGSLSEREVAALAGVAPFNQDSGAMRGQRRIWGGRASVRCALYMATLASLRHNPGVRTNFQRLRESGKPGKVAIVACMRKLLILLNALLKQKRRWEESRHVGSA